MMGIIKETIDSIMLGSIVVFTFFTYLRCDRIEKDIKDIKDSLKN